jgi:tetratricopeptide (TPR) repeat protein
MQRERFWANGFSEHTRMFQYRIKVILLLSWAMLGLSGVTRAEETSWQGYERLGDEAKQVSNWSQAEEAYQKAIDSLDKAFLHIPNNDTAALLNKFGEVLYERKGFKNAEAAYRRALSIYNWNLGPDDPKVATTLDLLGTSFRNQENGYDLAGPLYYRALAIREKAFGPDHPEVAESLELVGLSLYFSNGRLQPRYRCLSVRWQSETKHLATTTSLWRTV